MEGFSELLKGKGYEILPHHLGSDVEERVDELLSRNMEVSFLVPGDITFFTPFQHLIDRFRDVSEVIPGVTSLNLASSLIKRTFTLSPHTRSLVIFSTRSIKKYFGMESLSGFLGKDDTAAIFMNTWDLNKLKKELRAVYGKNFPVAIFRNLSLPGERIIWGTEDDWDPDMGLGRLDLVVVGPSVRKNE